MRGRAGALALLALGSAAGAGGQLLVPLTDLAAPYLGVGEPGLYPGGANGPSGDHLTLGLARAAGVVPRGTDGSPDPAGWIGVVELGISNTNQEGARFERESDRFGEHAGRVVLVDVAQGGIDATLMDEATDPYWGLFDARLAAAGVDPDQVQVAWIKSSFPGETTSGSFPARVDAFHTALGDIAGVLAARCPQLRLVFFSTRIWPASASRQTFAYESAFAVKQLIADQIADPGGLGTGPWLGWGPYLWAEGTNPRLDGFLWLPADLEPDGVHPAATAEWKVAGLLRDHFRASPLAGGWYAVADDTTLVARAAVADAVVDPAQPDTAGGTSAALAFDAGRRIYLRFDLTALAAPVLRAKLALLVDATNLVGPAQLHDVADDSWSESTLTWNGAPAIAPTPVTTVPNFSRGGAWSADVTAAVEAARQAGDPAISFALVPAGGGIALASFAARESGEPPRLVLTVATPPATTALWCDGFESGDAWFWD